MRKVVANAFFLYKKNMKQKYVLLSMLKKIIRTILLLIIGFLSFHVFDVTIQSIVLISCAAGKHQKEKDRKVCPFIHSSRFGTVVTQPKGFLHKSVRLLQSGIFFRPKAGEAQLKKGKRKNKEYLD